MTISPTKGKIQKTVKTCEKLLNKQHPLISEVAEVIGALVLQLLYRQPWIIGPSPQLLTHAHIREPHPLQKILRLMVCSLSGTPLHNKTFQQTLPTSSWHHGDEEHKSSTRHTAGVKSMSPANF